MYLDRRFFFLRRFLSTIAGMGWPFIPAENIMPIIVLQNIYFFKQIIMAAMTVIYTVVYNIKKQSPKYLARNSQRPESETYGYFLQLADQTVENKPK